MTDAFRFFRRCTAAAVLLGLAATGAQAQGSRSARGGDHIVAVVNSELVTNNEIEQRIARAQEDARRAGQRLPAADDLRRQIVDALIDERVQVTYAREAGIRVDDGEVERAVGSVAAQNQLTVAQLRERLKADGMDYKRFRDNLRDQLLVERVREREVNGRIRISDADVDKFLDERRSTAGAEPTLNIAQILVAVPEGADDATVAQRRARAEQIMARLKAGEDFATVARELSQDGNREKGGEIGPRPASRLPDLFVDAVKDLAPGAMTATPVRSGAGFHLLKLLSRDGGSGLTVTQTHARHILLRLSPQLGAEAATRRLEALRRQIESGQKRFEDVAREVSEDGSASSGGDLGWANPGMFVPEFEEAMNRLAPGAISAPLVSRFGVHLIQVLERRDQPMDLKQAREQARNVLREQKFDQTYADWLKELRNRAYVEMRESPQ